MSYIQQLAHTEYGACQLTAIVSEFEVIEAVHLKLYGMVGYGTRARRHYNLDLVADIEVVRTAVVEHYPIELVKGICGIVCIII